MAERTNVLSREATSEPIGPAGRIILPVSLRKRTVPTFAVVPETPQWYAIQTQRQCEKKIERYLRAYDLDSFLPVYSELHRWSDRNKVIEVPLFPGYVFLRAIVSAAVRSHILRAPGTVSFVGPQFRPAVIPDKEIETIRTLLKEQIPFQPHPFLPLGSRVRIRGGALDGIEGILVLRNTDKSLVVSVSLIQRSVALRVEGYEVQPASRVLEGLRSNRAQSR